MKIVLVAVVLFGSRPAWAGDCMGCGCPGVTPAVAVPEAYWGELRPADLGALPPDRDSSAQNEFAGDYWSWPYWMSLDVENGWVFAATNVGFQVWDATADPAHPTRVAFKNGRFGQFPWFNIDPHMTYPVAAVDAPEGTDDLVALAVDDGGGLVVWDTTTKAAPYGVYQHHGDVNRAIGVRAATIGGRAWAFVADSMRGLVVYDMTAARETGPCIEDEDVDGEECPGVYHSAISARTSGTGVGGVDTFVAYSASGAGSATELWDVADPRAPRLLLEIPPSAGVMAFATAMWADGDALYLVTRSEGEAAIYDVTCAREGGCAPPEPIWRGAISGGVSRLTATFSQSEDTPFLYFGSIDRCSGGPEREWLLDVGDPTAPRDVMPASAEGGTYWGWYYLANGTGPNRGVAPLVGKFSGRYFYRAASVILDVHEWTPPAGNDLPDEDESTPDGGGDDVPPPDEAEGGLHGAPGCSCGTAGPVPGVSLFALAALVAPRRKR